MMEIKFTHYPDGSHLAVHYKDSKAIVAHGSPSLSSIFNQDHKNKSDAEIEAERIEKECEQNREMEMKKTSAFIEIHGVSS